jgi:hypothetical protein
VGVGGCRGEGVVEGLRDGGGVRVCTHCVCICLFRRVFISLTLVITVRHPCRSSCAPGCSVRHRAC